MLVLQKWDWKPELFHWKPREEWIKTLFSILLLENSDLLKKDTIHRKSLKKYTLHFQLPGISLLLVKCSVSILVNYDLISNFKRGFINDVKINMVRRENKLRYK